MPGTLPFQPFPAAAADVAAAGSLGRRAFGTAVGLLLRVWVATWRVRWVRSDGGSQTRVLCFWHGRQMPLLSYERRRGAVVMVSLSRDGILQARILSLLGMRVVRGSSSRGGASGLMAFTRAMRDSSDGVFAVDGPCGPERRAKAGAICAAKLSGAELVPLGAAAFPAWAVQTRWERFLIPWPFARVVVVEGRVVAASAREDGIRVLESGLNEAEGAAESILREWRGVGVARWHG